MICALRSQCMRLGAVWPPKRDCSAGLFSRSAGLFLLTSFHFLLLFVTFCYYCTFCKLFFYCSRFTVCYFFTTCNFHKLLFTVEKGQGYYYIIFIHCLKGAGAPWFFFSFFYCWRGGGWRLMFFFPLHLTCGKGLV